MDALQLGIAHHLGWAVSVVATGDHRVVDRRRIELVEPGVSPAPVHHDGAYFEAHRSGPALDDDALAALVATVDASMRRASAAALDAITADVGPIGTISVRAWPLDLPTDIAVLRLPPHESRVDSYAYCRVLADLGTDRGWAVHTYDASSVERLASGLLGERADDVLNGPRNVLGAPWAKDHRQALAATVLASAG